MLQADFNQVTAESSDPTNQAENLKLGIGEDELGYIYVVVEKEDRLEVRKVLIQKESAKALILSDSIFLPNNPHPKRLLIKSLDVFARSKEEAVNQYMEGLNQTLLELEQTKLRTQQLMMKATEL